MPQPPQPNPAAREPDSSRAFALLLQLGMEPQDAYAFVEEMQSMASENLIARLESKLDALAAAHRSELATLRAEVAALRAEAGSFRWLIGGDAVLGAFIVTLLQLFITVRNLG